MAAVEIFRFTGGIVVCELAKVTLGGLNVPVTPPGRTDTEKATGPAKVLLAETVVWKLFPCPATIFNGEGLAEIVKSGAAVKTSWTVAVFVVPPLVPVTVMV